MLNRLFVLAVAVGLTGLGTHGLRAQSPAVDPTVSPDEASLGTEGFAMSGEVKIHYVTRGQGPLVIMIHGFPDYWYTWRHQMPAVAESFQVVAIDQRGYNKSGQPAGADQYAMELLVGDVQAVVRHFNREKAVIVGHDWGGMVAWSFAMAHPEMTDRLVILNLPHPSGLLRELATNPEQQRNSAYARYFQQPESAAQLTAEGLASRVRDPEVRARYLDAFKRSSFEAMLNYYKTNYPREPYTPPAQPFPPVKCPVLMFHGLKDQALLPGALNDTWKWVENHLTLVTVPGADHWVHHDSPDLVTRTLVDWLKR